MRRISIIVGAIGLGLSLASFAQEQQSPPSTSQNQPKQGDKLTFSGCQGNAELANVVVASVKGDKVEIKKGDQPGDQKKSPDAAPANPPAGDAAAPANSPAGDAKKNAGGQKVNPACEKIAEALVKGAQPKGAGPNPAGGEGVTIADLQAAGVQVQPQGTAVK